ncbi:MAG: NAD(+)/NADH kinase [Gemmatimonadota bacterium]|nr:NAD(+)/NADH kinase [Gemmatimonadota bacterium]MDH5759518.1 NAD(+)/NADH kinase [Gemmatimonadota bacterium]
MTAEGSLERFPGPIRRVGVVSRRRSPELPDILASLDGLLKARGLEVRYESDESGYIPPDAAPLRPAEDPVDLVLAVGGDGTLLRAARLVAGRGTPIFGINLGHLGFLTSTPVSAMREGVAQVLDGEGLLDRRFTLQARVVDSGGSLGDPISALNDFVLHTSGAARVTPLDLFVGSDGVTEEVGSFSADGVILSTPTGSTAYSMSAGGPIIVPGMACMVVTAICPHSLAVRPLVLPATETLTVQPMDPSHELQLTADGQVTHPVHPGECVRVTKGVHDVPLVRLPGQTFFSTMRRKLNWAARPPVRG